jgi:hypothetical protein
MVTLRPAVEETTETQLYERHAGRVFAYCFARVGTRNVAEWAVTATFDRARDALRNGGLSEPELDWLLRTADKFCGPRLRLRGGALDASGALVLADWDGLTFDEIAARLEASREQLDRARGELSPWRRVLGVLNLGPLLSWAKDAFTGATAVKAVAAAVAFTGAVVVVGTPVGDLLHDAVAPAPQSRSPARSEPGAPAPVSSPGRAGRPATAPVYGTLPSPVRAKGRPTRSRSGPGAAQSSTAAVQGGSEASPPPSGATGQPGATSTGAAAPASSPTAPAVSVPTAPSASTTQTPTVPEPTLTVPTSTTPVPLPAPPPAPDTSSLPVPTDETPTVPAPPDLGQVDVPSVPDAPSAPTAPSLP